MRAAMRVAHPFFSAATRRTQPKALPGLDELGGTNRPA
jgi:hypothetical protein